MRLSQLREELQDALLSLRVAAAKLGLDPPLRRVEIRGHESARQPPEGPGRLLAGQPVEQPLLDLGPQIVTELHVLGEGEPRHLELRSGLTRFREESLDEPLRPVRRSEAGGDQDHLPPALLSRPLQQETVELMLHEVLGGQVVVEGPVGEAEESQALLLEDAGAFPDLADQPFPGNRGLEPGQQRLDQSAEGGEVRFENVFLQIMEGDRLEDHPLLFERRHLGELKALVLPVPEVEEDVHASLVELGPALREVGDAVVVDERHQRQEQRGRSDAQEALVARQ